MKNFFNHFKKYYSNKLILILFLFIGSLYKGASIKVIGHPIYIAFKQTNITQIKE